MVTNNVLGRHLVATREIKKGEILLREAPLIYGPKMSSTAVCLGCAVALKPEQQGNFYKCSKCAWPLCGKNCETSPLHLEECKLMTARNFKAKIDFDAKNCNKQESAYCVILPLRCMLLKQSSKMNFDKFMSLESHLEQRKETPLYKVLTANLVTFIQTILNLTEWSDNDILGITARLDTNCFDVRQTVGGRKARAIYAQAAMISHDCVPNVRHTFDDQMNIIFLAKTNIAKGDVIATSYTQVGKI